MGKKKNEPAPIMDTCEECQGEGEVQQSCEDCGAMLTDDNFAQGAESYVCIECFRKVNA